jgi:hypothetical protein
MGRAVRIAVGWIATGIGVFLLVRYSQLFYSDTTPMRLFLTYWPAHLTGLALAFGGVLAIYWDRVPDRG